MTEIFKKRLMAAFIDLVSIGAAGSIILFIMAFLPFPGVMKLLSAIVIITAMAGLILIKDGPYQFEFLDKQSLGKKAMGIKVTKVDGATPITWNESIKRNIPLALPFAILIIMVAIQIIPIPFLTKMINGILSIIWFLGTIGIYGFETFVMFKDPVGQRWGDKKAETVVVEHY